MHFFPPAQTTKSTGTSNNIWPGSDIILHERDKVEAQTLPSAFKFNLILSFFCRDE